MQKEQLMSLLPKDRQWRVLPTCDDAEIRWGKFLLETRESHTVLHPVLTMIHTDTDMMEAYTIQKTSPGLHTRLVISPYPGLLVSNHVDFPTVMRPLMEQPKSQDFKETYVLQAYIEEELGISKLSDTWYVHGMLRLLQDVVVGGVDAEKFTGMLHAFEQICSLSAPDVPNTSFK